MKNKINSSSIDSKFVKHYEIGDIVRYCGDDFGDCVELKTGIILDIYYMSLFDGDFPYADVYVMGHDKQESVMLGNLAILYKVSD